MEIVEKYPNKPWNWGGLSFNPKITLELVEKYLGLFNWIMIFQNCF